jgi:2'-5' RNA ligase
VRLFVAINPPPPLRESVHAALAPLRAAAPAIHWTPAEKLHATVRFLGEQPEAMVGPFIDMLKTAAAGFSPIPMTLGTLGAFPAWRRARVVWVGATGEPKLELLHHDIEVGFVGLGLEVEGRPFRPHVTVARLHGEGGGTVAAAIREAARGVRIREAMMVESLDLMASEPTETGVRYVRLASAPLSRRH